MDSLGTVEFTLESGAKHTLFHGDIIGRLWSAAMRLDDARISEAHAMVSNRGREMKLLALRGRFMVNGKAGTDVPLREAMRVTLAPGIEVEVSAVTAPSHILMLSAEGVAPRTVPGVLSLYGGANPRIRTGWRPDADGTIWPTGEGWMRSGKDGPMHVVATSEWKLAGTVFRAWVESAHTGTIPTKREASLSLPLRIIARFDTVHLVREGHPVLVITGRSARLMSELAVVAQPCSWHSQAQLLWGELERNRLRRRWDMQLRRLRQKLRGAAIRTDLIQPTGDGLIELVLGPNDVVVDET